MSINPLDGIAFGKKLPHKIHFAVGPNCLDAPDVAVLHRR
jgi:hypothetical protein